MTEHGRPKHCAILVRHAMREMRWNSPENEHRMAGWEYQHPDPKSNFDEKDEKGKNGFTLTYALAGRLCDQLLADKIAVKKIIYSSHLVAMQTASVYKHVLEKRKVNKEVLGDSEVFGVEMEKCEALTPGCYSYEAVENIKEELENDDSTREQPVSVAYVLVGHQPELTTIARLWLQRWRWVRSALPFQTLPIEGSESACLALSISPRLLWLITNKQKALMDDLKDKIKSKYDVAKFFLGPSWSTPG
jgi:hypothetical protein